MPWNAVTAKLNKIGTKNWLAIPQNSAILVVKVNQSLCSVIPWIKCRHHRSSWKDVRFYVYEITNSFHFCSSSVENVYNLISQPSAQCSVPLMFRNVATLHTLIVFPNKPVAFGRSHQMPRVSGENSIAMSRHWIKRFCRMSCKHLTNPSR